jgi:putative phosphoribosyl transferase
MIASLRWARAAGAARVVAAAPVGPTRTLQTLRDEADEVVCPYALDDFFAVGVWYASFRQVGDEEVVRLLAESRQRHPRALLRRAAPAGGAR